MTGLLLFALFFQLWHPSATVGADFLSAGPLFHQFYLTLTPGQRTEAVSPFFYQEQAETQKTWAVPPLISYTTD